MSVVICAIIKDETEYIEEWIDYHKSIHFDKIYLFEDENSVSHQSIADKYKGFVELYLLSDIKQEEHITFKQYDTYMYFIKKYKDKHKWCAFIDIDEYIRIDAKYNNDIHNFLKEYNKERGVFLFWKLYGADGRLNSCEKGNIQKTYTKELPLNLISKNNREIQKTIVNLSLFKTLGSVHIARRSVNTEHKALFDAIYTNAWIDHYFTKSWEDWLKRMKRGDITYNLRFIKTFFEINEDMNYLKEELTKNLNWDDFPSINQKK